MGKDVARERCSPHGYSGWSGSSRAYCEKDMFLPVVVAVPATSGTSETPSYVSLVGIGTPPSSSSVGRTAIDNQNLMGAGQQGGGVLNAFGGASPSMSSVSCSVREPAVSFIQGT